MELQGWAGVDIYFPANLHEQERLHQVDALTVGGPENRKADVIDIGCEFDLCLALHDGDFPSKHLVAAMAGPHRGAISPRWNFVAVDVERQRSLVPRIQIAGNCILGTGDHEVPDPVGKAVEREAEMGKLKRRSAVARIQDFQPLSPGFRREAPVLDDLCTVTGERAAQRASASPRSSRRAR